MEMQSVIGHQLLLRAVNDRLAARSEEELPQLLCECADPACLETIPVPLADHERLAPTRRRSWSRPDTSGTATAT